ncbi:MAG: DUF512 domain-containing protein [Bacillota bacterium]
MAEITNVKSGSPAERAGLKVGDDILTINDKNLRDYIDYLYSSLQDELVLEYIDAETGEKKKKKISLNNEELGLDFSKIVFDHLKKCKNKCIFCFVDQQPKNSRPSLTVKDDDYRFSFLQGSFITLTNLSNTEKQRIIKEKLSPLYISVHATEPELRVKLMGNPRAGEIMHDLRELAQGGISFHLQLVLIPEVNDGEHLARSLDDLLSLGEAVESIGIVPVGLTGYRENLLDLKSYDKTSAQKIIEQVKDRQKNLDQGWRGNYIFLADEFYLLADQEPPKYEDYAEFPQLENGIGLTRLARDKYLEIKGDYKTETVHNDESVIIITSELGRKALCPVWLDLQEEAKVEVLTAKSNYLGGEVTVTGLLAGQDIIELLKHSKYRKGKVILPGIIFNQDRLTLDNYSLKELKEELSEFEIKVCEDIIDLMEVIYHGETNSGDSR